MSPTEQYIEALSNLKSGDLGLLRTHAGQGLDQSVEGFDLFAGLWWPLRDKNHRAPRRQVAWLIAKLYACCPIEHADGQVLGRQLRQCWLHVPADKRERFRALVDQLLVSSLAEIEPAIRWALMEISDRELKLDWVKLTDDLSIWERESTRLRWAEQFIANNGGLKDVD